MMKKDYYDILGVPRDVDATTLKKAYRKLALKYHPDRNKENKEQAEEKFKEAAEAYSILSNPEKRRAYDQFGYEGVKNNTNYSSSMDEIFKQFGDIFSGSFWSGGSHQRSSKKGANLRITLKVTLEETAKGASKKIKLKRYVSCKSCKGNGAKNGTSSTTCNACNGSGKERYSTGNLFVQMFSFDTCAQCQGEGKIIESKCTDCRGEGRKHIEEIIDIKLPSGMAEGIEYRMPQKGDAPLRGGIPGDLFILIEELPHELFKRDSKNNIHYKCYLSLAELVTGSEVEIPTLEEPTKIKVPAKTQSGYIHKLKNKGIPDPNGYRRGNLLIHVYAWTPQKLTKEEIDQLKKLCDSKNFTPTPSKEDSSFFDKIKRFFE